MSPLGLSSLETRMKIEAHIVTIDDYAKDGGEELFTKMHCVLFMNS